MPFELQFDPPAGKPKRVTTVPDWRWQFCDIKTTARNGTVIIKFWLNVSREEQKRRFLARLDNTDKNWKFEPGDVVERRNWNEYMHAYEEALNATSRPWAPWYAIPADDKRYMRARVAEIIIESLRGIGLRYPVPSEEDYAEFAEARRELEAESE